MCVLICTENYCVCGSPIQRHLYWGHLVKSVTKCLRPGFRLQHWMVNSAGKRLWNTCSDFTSSLTLALTGGRTKSVGLYVLGVRFLPTPLCSPVLTAAHSFYLSHTVLLPEVLHQLDFHPSKALSGYPLAWHHPPLSSPPDTTLFCPVEWFFMSKILETDQESFQPNMEE